MQSFQQDLKFAFSLLVKNKLFSAVAILTLALCIGANTTIFSVIHGVLLQPLPFPEGDRLVTLFNVYPAVAPSHDGENRVADYLDRKEETDVFESLLDKGVVDTREALLSSQFSVVPQETPVTDLEQASGKLVVTRLDAQFEPEAKRLIGAVLKIGS